MNTYSHIVIANRLEPYIKPEAPQEYLWGAIAPDIRYLADVPRSQTHLASEVILDYMVQYPHLKAFLQGYLVHCLSDELSLARIIQQKFPFYLLKNKLAAQHYPVMLELFNVERVRPPRIPLSGTYNQVLSELGIREEQTTKFAQAANQYLMSPSVASAITLVHELGLADDGMIEKYRAAAQQFQSRWLQRELIFWGLHVGRVNQEIASLVQSALPRMDGTSESLHDAPVSWVEGKAAANVNE